MDIDLVAVVLRRRAPPPTSPRIGALALDDAREVLAHLRHRVGDLRHGPLLFEGGDALGWIAPRAHRRAAIPVHGHSRREGLWWEIDAALAHHPELAVQGLEATVEACDYAPHRLRVARDQPGPRISRRALGLAGPGHYAELNLPRVPCHEVHARIATRRIHANVGRIERGWCARVALHEGVVDDGVPLPFALGRISNPRLQRRRRPTELGIRDRELRAATAGRRDRELGFGLGLRIGLTLASHSEIRTLEHVANRKNAVLEPSDRLGPDEAEPADGVDQPCDFPRLPLLGHPDLDAIGAFVDDHAPHRVQSDADLTFGKSQRGRVAFERHLNLRHRLRERDARPAKALAASRAEPVRYAILPPRPA